MVSGFVFGIGLFAMKGHWFDKGNLMKRRFMKRDIKKLRGVLDDAGLYPGVDVYLIETVIEHFISLSFVTTSTPFSENVYTEAEFTSHNVMIYNRPEINIICELNFIKSVTWLTTYGCAEGFFDYHEEFLKATVDKIKLQLLTLTDDVIYFNNIVEATEYPRVPLPEYSQYNKI